MLARMTRALALGLVLALLAPVATARAQSEPAALTEATIVEREGAVEVWVRLTRAARYQAELIDSPARLVLDFDDTLYRWTAKPPATTPPEPVRDVRGSQYRKGVARLVVELRRRATYTIERDREGLRIIFPRERSSAEPAPAPAARRPPGQPLLYGIVMLDAEAHAYIYDPALHQVRRYRVGDSVGDAVIETIGEKHVVLKTPTGRVELRVDETKPR
jgi:AMIN domain-containing protein